MAKRVNDHSMPTQHSGHKNDRHKNDNRTIDTRRDNKYFKQ